MSNKVALAFDRTKTFLHEVRLEMQKVTWPTRDQVKNYTVVVMVATVALAVVIGLWDSLLGLILVKITGIGG